MLRAHPEGDVLLDCVTNMVTNLMLDEEPEYEALSRARVEEIEAHIEEEIDRLLSGLRQRSGLAVLVTRRGGARPGGALPHGADFRRYSGKGESTAGGAGG